MFYFQSKKCKNKILLQDSLKTLCVCVELIWMTLFIYVYSNHLDNTAKISLFKLVMSVMTMKGSIGDSCDGCDICEIHDDHDYDVCHKSAIDDDCNR